MANSLSKVPKIIKVTPSEATVGTLGVSISGIFLCGKRTTILNMICGDTTYNISKNITSKSYSEIRFTVPYFISGKYYIQVITEEGESNVF